MSSLSHAKSADRPRDAGTRHGRPSDVVYDLGSGDGRIPMTAAKEYGAVGRLVASVLFGLAEIEQEYRRERQAAGDCEYATSGKGGITVRSKGRRRHSPPASGYYLSVASRWRRLCTPSRSDSRAPSTAIWPQGRKRELFTDSALRASWRLVTRVLILVANAKMRIMILFTLGSEGQSNRVDSYAETPDSVGESRVERIRHQYQCWVWAYTRWKVAFGLIEPQYFSARIYPMHLSALQAQGKSP